MESWLADAVFSATALLALGVIGVGFFVRRQYDDPGVEGLATFCWLVGVAGIVSSAYGVLAVDPGAEVSSGDPTSIGIWYTTVLSLMYLAPIPWGAFVLNYTGKSRDLDPSRRAEVAFSLVVVSVPLLLWSDYAVAAFEVGQLPTPVLFGVFAAFVGSSLFSLTAYLSASVVLLYTTYVYNHLRTTGGVSLAMAATVPLGLLWLSAGLIFSSQVSLTVLGFATVGLAIAVFGGGVLLGVTRHDAFENTPAAGNVGREMLMEELEDLVVVLDHEERVSDVNPAAAERICKSQREALGKPVEGLLGTGVDRLRSTDAVELSTVAGRRQFDPQVSDLTDQHDREIGTVVTLRDVTRRQIREQRLEVFNRVLRHNLRNKLAIVKGTADTIAGLEDAPAAADRLGRAADELMELGEQARTIEQIMRDDDPDDTSVGLHGTVEDVVSEVAGEYPDVRFETDLEGDPTLLGDEKMFRHLLGNVVENAAEHNTSDRPRVRVAVSIGEDESAPVSIAVEDNGPGIPEHERAVIARETETPLEHGSGLGLWTANWCVKRLGGTLSFEESPLGGARVVVDVPETSPSHSLEFEPSSTATAASGD